MTSGSSSLSSPPLPPPNSTANNGSGNNTTTTSLTITSNGSDSLKKRKLQSANEFHNDSTLIKSVPDVYDRFVDVRDHTTNESCNALMCKSCRLLVKKNVLLVSSHLCKQRDVERHISLPVSGTLLFRSKPKNRATPIWDEFEEVFEPSSGTLLGYARCKRCREIIKTSDPKSIPAVLRRHLPLCPCGPFPASLLITPIKSETTITGTAESLLSIGSNSLLRSNEHASSANGTDSEAEQSKHKHSTVYHHLSQNLSTPATVAPVDRRLRDHMKNSNGFSRSQSPAEFPTARLLAQHTMNGSASNSLPVSIQSPSAVTSSSSSGSSPSSSAANGHSNVLNNGHSSSSSSSSSFTQAITNPTKLLQLKTQFRERCIEFCCSELVSLETIASDSFRLLGQSLMSLGAQCAKVQQLPDTSQLYTQMHAHFSSVRLQLRKELDSELLRNLGGALVCDSQDDLCVMSTFHVNSNWQLIETVLSATTNGSDINSFITRTLEDYGLYEENKLTKFTFVSRGGVFDGVQVCLNSVAHTIDQVIENSIFFDDTFIELVESCRLICVELGIDVKPEVSVESVEWILKYELMRNVLKNQDKFELTNSELNLHFIQFWVDLLTPFKIASVELRQCSRHPTLNHVLLWYYKIMKALQMEPVLEGKLSDEERKFMSHIRRTIRQSVETHFKLTSFHKIAVFLWPNFRTLKMLSSSERNQVHTEVRSLMESRLGGCPSSSATGANQSNNKHPVQTAFEPSIKKARTDFADWEEDAGDLLVQDEIDRYVGAMLAPCDEASLLNWWRDHQSEFPRLAQLAKWILSIPASVTSLEKYKLNTSQKMDEELLFLHCNLYV